MEQYVGTLSKVIDPNARRLLVLLIQDNMTLREEIDHLKAKRGVPTELKVLAAKKANIITK